MTFYNPVIPGFHPDPSVCRVGDEYFLVASSFTYCPGLPDLPVVEPRGLDPDRQRPRPTARTRPLGTPGSSSLGIFAPTLRHHDGRFWAITTRRHAPGPTRSSSPRGPGRTVVGARPGAVTRHRPRPGLGRRRDLLGSLLRASGGIVRRRLDTVNGGLLGGPDPTWSGTGLQYPEAPHLLERDGTWYLLIAEGGTERATRLGRAGPSPAVPGGCTGQPDPQPPAAPTGRFRTPGTPTWSRPRTEPGGWCSSACARRGLARIPRLGPRDLPHPAAWVDGWPVPGELALEMPIAPGPPEVPRPLAQRTSRRRHSAPHWVGRPPAPGRGELADHAPGLARPLTAARPLWTPRSRFVGRRQQHHHCRARSRVDAAPAAEAGLTVCWTRPAHYDVAVRGDRVVARARIGSLGTVVADDRRLPRPRRARRGDGATRPWTRPVALGYQDDPAARRRSPELDGRYLSTEVTGGFLGRMIGMYAVGGEAAFDWFDYEET